MKHLYSTPLALLAFLYCYADTPEDFVKNNKIICELTTEEYVAIIRPFLPHNPNILEAGAHGGQETVILGHSWPKGTVFAFEPVPKFIGFIQHEITKHRVHNAKLFPYALFSSSGERTFYYSNSIGAASSLLESNNLCDYQDSEMKVHCINLDHWAKQNNVDHIDFMWLDMEGAEYHVLNSAPTILKTVRVIITEINFREFRKGMTQYTDLYTLLTSNGFTLYKIWGSPVHQGTALFVRSSLLDN